MYCKQCIYQNNCMLCICAGLEIDLEFVEDKFKFCMIQDNILRNWGYT